MEIKRVLEQARGIVENDGCDHLQCGDCFLENICGGEQEKISQLIIDAYELGRRYYEL